MEIRFNRKITEFGFSFLLSILLLSTGWSQDTQTKYQRKSISYINAVLPIGDKVKLNGEQENFLLKTIKQEIEMSRFDYNPLPENLLASFKQELKNSQARTIDAVAGVMNDVLVPKIMELVDLEKEMRAQGLVSEADKHSFIVEKAKETGITTEDLEAVMNSAYIYLPIIEEVKEYEYSASKTINYDLHGGIIWFSIKTGATGTEVALLVKKETVGKGAAKIDASINYRGRQMNGKQYAFVTAAEVLARNLKVATQEIPDFQLTNPLGNTGSGWVEFGMGKKEGIGVDDKFIITEFHEGSDGKLTQKKLGMVRVSKVADNTKKDADSRARVVIGGRYERGQVALEHPRLPIDISVRLGILPLAADDAPKLDQTTGLYELGEATGGLTTVQLFFNYNLAKSTGWSQFFGVIYGEIGGGTLDDWDWGDGNVPGGAYWGVGGGLVKKFYVNRLHIGIEALLAYSDYTFGDTWTDPTTGVDYDWEWNMGSIGMNLNGNVEIALSYDWNLGAGVSYRMFSPSEDWTYTENDDEIDLSTWNSVPDLKYGGLGFQVYLTWSLPSLSYDPIKMARGTIGQ